MIAFSAMPDAVETARRVGVESILPKPFHIADLIRLVAGHAAGHAAGHTVRPLPGTTPAQ